MPLTRLPAALITLVLIACLASAPAKARDLAVDRDTLIPVELATVGVDQTTGSPLVLLRDPSSGEVVPIVIGVNEARAILFAMHEVETPRPMTHDLFGGVFAATEMVLQRVIVDDLRDNTFLGMLELQVGDKEEPVLVDSRPSDALALAVRTGATIHIAPRVLEQAGQHFDFESPDDDQVVTALGITVVELTADLREALELPEQQGVLVSRATGAAAEAGMTEGAVILAVDGEAPESPMAFLDLVREIPEDEEAAITFWQDGEEQTIQVPVDVPTVPEGDGPRIQL